MTAPPCSFSKDVSLFILDDVGIVFSEAAQEIYELNAAATWIWCQLDEGIAFDDLPRALTATFGFEEAKAQHYLSETLKTWKDLGFLNGKEALKERSSSIRKARAPSPTSSLPRRLLNAIKGRRLPQNSRRPIAAYSALSQDVAVIFPSQDIADLVHPSVAHVTLGDIDRGRQMTLVEVEETREGYRIKVDGKMRYRCSLANELTPILQYLVFAGAISKSAYSVAFHAGAVAIDGQVAVLPGNAGSGKTSLTAALISCGFQYLSDDLLLMSEDLRIEGVPFALCIKDTGVAPLEPYYPDISSLALHNRQDGKKVRYLPPPPTAFLKDSPARLPASWVIFPTYRPEGETTLTPLSKSKALRQLLETCTLALPLTHDQVRTFVRWLEALRCYELKVTSLAEGVAAVKGVMISNNEGDQRPTG